MNASVGMVWKKLLVPAETCPSVCMYDVSRNVSVCMAQKGLLVPAEICPGVCMYGVSRNTSVGKARKVLLVSAETCPGVCLQLRCLAECVLGYGSERAARSCRDLPLYL